MIRIEEDRDWLLLEHAAHAALAGEFARHWKNESFAPPEPFAHILDACARHDDSWQDRDADPLLTPEGNPSAFSRELVGTYDAFEEIDLAEYLGVRGQATETAAARDPYAAILISMHTVNLLTEQADLSGLSPDDATLHRDFIDGQKRRQEELRGSLVGRPGFEELLAEDVLSRGFRFLQACDSFSLFVGVDFPEDGELRHAHLRRDGSQTAIRFRPQGNRHYVLDPYPLDEPRISFAVPYRRVAKAATSSLATFRQAYAEAPVEPITITVGKD